jgi:hypothetical protein
MAPINRKRAADSDEEIEVVSSKKIPKTSANIGPQQQQQMGESLFLISIQLQPRFDKFPLQLRQILQREYANTFYNHTAALQQTPANAPAIQTYTLISGTRTRGESPSYTLSRASALVPDLTIANVLLLGLFLDKKKRTMQNPQFQQLETQEGLENPEFLQLHSVRHGEVGWGFDARGCLSLYVACVREKKLVEGVYYVGEGEIKIEGE